MMIINKFLKPILFFTLAFLLVLALGCASFAEEGVTDAEAELAEAVPTPEPVSPYAGMIVINELMVKNHATLRDEEGDFSDWIELHNISGTDIELGGFTISDDAEGGWAFPKMTLAADSYLLVFADGKDLPGTVLHTDFSLSKGEIVYLRDANGIILDRALCECDTPDVALKLAEDQSWLPDNFATPGYPNTDEGYEAWQNTVSYSSPLIITQVMTFSSGMAEQTDIQQRDWLILRNISGSDILLSDYCLSDDRSELDKFNLPKRKLFSGESVLVFCDDSTSSGANFIANFKLNSSNERVYLSKDGKVEDFVFLHDIPAGCSFARIAGMNGWFYNPNPSTYLDTKYGYRAISTAPTVLTKDGIFNDCRTVRIELAGEGDIYYTIDGSRPTTEDRLYTAPFAVSSTCCVRAVAVQGNKMPSACLTLNYILNEGHSLPVVCLNSDDPFRFQLMYNGGKKDIELSGSISLYDGHDRFTVPCGIDMHGGKSLEMKQKNMGIFFRDAYGQNTLEYDLFGGGVTTFNSLILRAGQDYNRAKIRNELFENLCLQYSDSTLTQRSKYCVLYINGEYWGIYALMEKLNGAYYANRFGVSKDSVTIEKAPIENFFSFYKDIIEFSKKNDLTKAGNYAEFCRRMDIDSLIDWLIIEGYCANEDLNLGNVRYCKSTEDDGKWRVMLYDLDSTMNNSEMCFAVLKRVDTSYGVFTSQLIRNTQFREKFLARAAEVLSTTLSDENVLSEIDRLAAQLEDDVPRDLKNNNLDARQWETSVNNLKGMITDFNWHDKCIDAICKTMKLDRSDWYTDGETQ